MEILLLSCLILLNGFFAMSEISLVTARKARLQRQIDQGDRGAQIAVQLGTEPTKFLSTIQIGITSAAMFSGIVGEATLSPPIEARLVAIGLSAEAAAYVATGIVVAGVTFFAIVVGELVPKLIGQTHAETIARLVSRPIHTLAIISKPFVMILSGSTHVLLKLLRIDDRSRNAVTEEEIHAVLAEGSESGAIEKDEHRMVRNLFRLDDLAIVSFMTPRVDMVTIEATATEKDVLDLLENSSHSRYPVVRHGTEDIVGLISARELLLRTLAGESLSLEAGLRPPVFVPESISGMELLDSFRNSTDHVAFVVDEYGTVLGLITLHDLLEAITGVFKDSASDDRRPVQRENDSWAFDGKISIHELFDHLTIQEPADSARSYRTLSGLIIHQLERIPRKGDRIEWQGWLFEIIDMDGNRVDRVLAARAPAVPREIKLI